MLGNNAFAYCINNPVIYRDTGGTAIETVFDIISLGASIADVAINPTDPWAWIGLIGDVADVAIPCVGGLGEAVRALKSVNALDKSVDIAKITQNTLEVISTVAHTVSTGEQFVYTADIVNQKGILEYVGITNDYSRRKNEWSQWRTINEYITGVDRTTARCAEQAVITLFGKGGNNTLSNIRNSIGKKSKIYTNYVDFMLKLFK